MKILGMNDVIEFGGKKGTSFTVIGFDRRGVRLRINNRSGALSSLASSEFETLLSNKTIKVIPAK